MKFLLAALVAILLCPLNASATGYQRVPPGAATTKVIYLVPRNAPITVATQGFYFVTDTPFDLSTAGLTGCSTVTSTTAFYIPKVDPYLGSGDNPAYRDNVNSLMLAYSLARPIALYVDFCITPGSYGRVVGIDVL